MTQSTKCIYVLALSVEGQTGEDEASIRHDEGVPEVNQRPCCVRQTETRVVIIHRVQHHIHPAGGATKEGTPPPVGIFAAVGQHEIASKKNTPIIGCTVANKRYSENKPTIKSTPNKDVSGHSPNELEINKSYRNLRACNTQDY